MMESKKRTYNFVFNSLITSSYTGTRWEANYRVDFKSIIPYQSMKSSYLMTFRFSSYNMTTANFDPTNKMITLYVSLGSQTRNSLNTRPTNHTGVLKYSANTYPSTTTCIFAFDTSPNDNQPIYIESIQDVTTIQLALIDGLQTKFTAAPNYICILSFEEL